MEFANSLTQAVLLKRYKRFLAEIVLNNQEHQIIYCPNTGAMTGCDVLGSRIWFSHSENPRRKFPGTWELVEVNGGYLVCVNTQYTNQLVIEAIQNGTIEELKDYSQIIQDPPLLEENGFDLLLEKNSHFSDEQENISPLCGESCFMVIKSVTLGDEIHRGFFPEIVTQGGAQQLKSLIHAKQLGYRAVLFYNVLHTGIERVFPADHIDPQYGQLLRQAVIAGVEIFGYRVDINFNQIKIAKKIEVCVPARLIGTSRSEKSK
jgi:sugar fermentation stimulation protein A